MIPMGRVKLQRYVEERKKEWEGYLTVQPADADLAIPKSWGW